MTTQDPWEKLAEFGVTKVELLKLDCESAEYTILETLSRTGHPAHVGWIRGEWRSCILCVFRWTKSKQLHPYSELTQDALV